MRKVGLTGGIGSGKSTVADLFAAKGVPVLDADVVSRTLVEPGSPALLAIAKHFGGGILTPEGTLHRALLRRMVFEQPEQKRWLESLLHPLVYSALEAGMEELGPAQPYCILVIPLLLESGRRDFVDRLIVVDCPEELQRQRVAARDGLTREAIDRILAGQTSRAARLAAADHVIGNTGSRGELSLAVDRLHRFFMTAAA